MRNGLHFLFRSAVSCTCCIKQKNGISRLMNSRFILRWQKGAGQNIYRLPLASNWLPLYLQQSYSRLCILFLKSIYGNCFHSFRCWIWMKYSHHFSFTYYSLLIFAFLPPYMRRCYLEGSCFAVSPWDGVRKRVLLFPLLYLVLSTLTQSMSYLPLH